jgi:CO/xanthine dehydrogenase FAD-binding subunit
MSFLIARSIEEAVTALAEGARPVAGGSDLVVGARHGADTLPSKLVAIDRIRELKVLQLDDTGCTIGAGVTHAQLMTDATIVQHYPALADASALVGSPSTRNVGTLGGNIMNGSPAMDTGAPLLVLDAAIELRSQSGQRRLAIGALWSGPGTTTAAAGELCTAVLLPPAGERSSSAYVRLEYRRAMEIAVVGAAASITLNADGTIAGLNLALAAVAPTIMSVELDFAGRQLNDATLALIAQAASTQARPISDLRASDTYRRHTIGVMAKRAVDAAARRANGELIAVPVNHALGIGASS